jgi:hypothetical protein
LIRTGNSSSMSKADGAWSSNLPPSSADLKKARYYKHLISEKSVPIFRAGLDWLRSGLKGELLFWLLWISGLITKRLLISRIAIYCWRIQQYALRARDALPEREFKRNILHYSARYATNDDSTVISYLWVICDCCIWFLVPTNNCLKNKSLYVYR